MRWTALFLLVCVLAGCARSAAPPSSAASPSAASPSSSSAGPSTAATSTGAPSAAATSGGALSITPLPTLDPPSKPPKTPTDSFKEITVQGALRITQGCVDLVTGTVTWTLLGLPEGALSAARLEVTGTPAPEAETACSGSPLRVRTATRIG